MQSKRESFIEVCVNVAIGFWISWLLNLLVLPHYGCSISVADSTAIGVIYTVASVIRGYMIRRFFNSKLKAFVRWLSGVLPERKHV